VSRPADIMTVVAWTFSLAASGFFPALVLGVWWKRATSRGAVAGMLTGFAAALGYLAMARLAPDFGAEFLGMVPVSGAGAVLAGEYVETVASGTLGIAPAVEVGWFGISSLAAAMIGVPAGFAAMIGISLLTRPNPESAEFVDEIRTPRGLSYMEKERAAERVREFGRRRR